jgi:tRNA A37 N6-isopentenylltransferase MiaA
MSDLGLEYRYVAQYLQKAKNLPPLKLRQAKEEMIEKLNTEIWHFAKRQKTWFKRDKSIIWINPLETYEKAEAMLKIKSFLK